MKARGGSKRATARFATFNFASNFASRNNPGYAGHVRACEPLVCAMRLCNAQRFVLSFAPALPPPPAPRMNIPPTALFTGILAALLALAGAAGDPVASPCDTVGDVVQPLGANTICWRGRVFVAMVDAPMEGADGAPPRLGAGDTHDEPGSDNFYFHIGMAALCICGAALAAGLTMGMMSLDPLTVDVVSLEGSEADKARCVCHAPLRPAAHLSLVLTRACRAAPAACCRSSSATTCCSSRCCL